MIIRNTTTVDEIGSRKVLCKALTNINFYVGNRSFDSTKAIYIILKTVKLKKPSYDNRKYISESLSVEQAKGIFAIMLQKGYIEFYQFFKNKPGTPIGYKNGTKLYKLGQLRLAECQETTWYKNRERKEKYLNKERELDVKRCKAIQQIYSLFGSTPFTFNMIKYTVDQIVKLTHKENKLKLTKMEMMAIDHMKTKLYGTDSNSFINTWQSLITSNYIIPHKIRTTNGYIKNTGMFKINHTYLKQCNAESI